MLDLTLQPRRDALLRGHANVIDVLFRVAAPPAPDGVPPRKRLNLSLVIDRSGSMSGQPLAEARACAIAMVRKLTPTDLVSVVTYDSHVDVVVPTTKVTSPDEICARIAAITEGGSTALHAGWAAGAEQAALRQAEADISRILLLSDGCANQGITDSETIATHCRDMARSGVSTSTYGLGRHFNEDLMTEMANAGAGNAYYGRTARDLAEPFEQEFDLLLATCARDLLLSIDPAPGVTIEMANDLETRPEGWQLPDIAWNSEAWALTRVTVPAALTRTGGEGPLLVLKAMLGWQSLEGVDGQTTARLLMLPSLPLQAFEALPEDPVVVQRASELLFARLQRAAARAARANDWDRVAQILDEARQAAHDNPWLAESMRSLERFAERRDRLRFSKQAAYSARFVGKRLTERNEAALFDADLERLKPSFLRRKTDMGKGSKRPGS